MYSVQDLKDYIEDSSVAQAVQDIHPELVDNKLVRLAWETAREAIEELNELLERDDDEAELIQGGGQQRPQLPRFSQRIGSDSKTAAAKTPKLSSWD